MGKQQQMARAAGKLARQWLPAVKQSGKAARSVLPGVIKPFHSLWHDILSFLFLAVAGIGAWKLYRNPGRLNPVELFIVVLFIVVMASYGISSWRKSRRISRS